MLDDRARLAFGAGQCHGLALALHRSEGWPLVVIDDEDGRRIHVCVRRPDGALVDVNGAHLQPDLSDAWPDCSVHDITTRDIHALVEHQGWAEPEVEKATAWVDPVLRQADDPSQSRAPFQVPILQATTLHASIEIRFAWSGDPWVDVHIRRVPALGVQWVPYSQLQFPRDASGRHVIDFRPQTLTSFVQVILQRQFDVAKAEAKLRST